MSNNSGKFYPPSSSEIAKLLGLERDEVVPTVEPVSTVLPAGLPGSEAVKQGDIMAEGVIAEEIETVVALEEAPEPKSHGTIYSFVSIITGALPYIAVFAVGLLGYYFFFAEGGMDFNFGRQEISLEEQAKTEKEAAIAQLKQDESEKYIAWISQFYFDVSDGSVIEMDKIANNGLTNFENYLLQLNPKNYDTLQNGQSDAQNLLNGINPKSGQPLTDTERDIIAKYFDVETIRQRVSFLPDRSSDRANQFAAGTSQPNTESGIGGLPTGGANMENRLEINTAIPGRLEIPTIGVNTPIIWTKNPADFDMDLRRGIVHYPGTPLPGSLGTSYISGHSSNFAWVKADFNKVFARLNELPDGATFKITAVGPEGKNIWLHYVVERKQEFLPDDQAQFTNTADSIVALSTCWPINTTQRRLVAFGKLNQIEYQ